MKNAFSLVELSIVLVILGLLTGGILAGRSLIRASEVRAVTVEAQRYISALHGFRDKYFAVPGDITNAQSFWGIDPDGCPGTNTTITYSAGTCNGNGDGSVVPSNNEMYRAWQHMSNAGLIEGSFSGVPDSSSASTLAPKIGTNAPASKVTNAGWSIYIGGERAISNTYLFEGSYGSPFFFGSAVANSLTDGPALRPEEAWNVDTKMDDGRPGIGKVRTTEGSTPCHDAGTSTSVAIGSTANYSLNNSTILCPLVFLSGY